MSIGCDSDSGPNYRIMALYELVRTGPTPGRQSLGKEKNRPRTNVILQSSMLRPPRACLLVGQPLHPPSSSSTVDNSTLTATFPPGPGVLTNTRICSSDIQESNPELRILFVVIICPALWPSTFHEGAHLPAPTGVGSLPPPPLHAAETPCSRPERRLYSNK